MLICVECKKLIGVDEGTSYVLPKVDDPPDTRIEYLHFPECSTKYFRNREEAYIIKGEN